MSGPTDALGPLALEPAQPTELAEIVALANRAYRGIGGWNAESDLIEGERITLAQIEADLAEHRDARLLVHRDPANGQALACVRLDPEGGGAWLLGLLAVDPEHQSRQLGRRLLAAAEDCVRREGGTRVRMSVINLRESLIGWYERRGYQATGEAEPYPYGDERFGRPLRQHMSFLVLEKTLADMPG